MNINMTRYILEFVIKVMTVGFPRTIVGLNQADQGPVSRKILSLELDLSSLITLVTIVFPCLRSLEDLRFFDKLAPVGVICLS